MLILLFCILAGAYIGLCVWFRHTKISFFAWLAALILFFNLMAQPKGEPFGRQYLKDFFKPSAEEINITKPYHNLAPHILYGPSGKPAESPLPPKNYHSIWLALFFITAFGAALASIANFLEFMAKQIVASKKATGKAFGNFFQLIKEGLSAKKHRAAENMPLAKTECGFFRRFFSSMAADGAWDMLGRKIIRAVSKKFISKGV